jgi:hypothetical protein
MNHMPEGCLPASVPAFTPKQGQYLAFIHASHEDRRRQLVIFTSCLPMPALDLARAFAQ